MLTHASAYLSEHRTDLNQYVDLFAPGFLGLRILMALAHVANVLQVDRAHRNLA